jgi:hypothetical protein
MRNLSGVVSWYQPDTIVHATIGKSNYLFIANEGDSKGEARRVKELTSLDPSVFKNATAVRQVCVTLFGGAKLTPYVYNYTYEPKAQGQESRTPTAINAKGPAPAGDDKY